MVLIMAEPQGQTGRTLLLYCFATASVLMFWRMKAVLAEFDREDGVGRD